MLVGCLLIFIVYSKLNSLISTKNKHDKVILLISFFKRYLKNGLINRLVNGCKTSFSSKVTLL